MAPNWKMGSARFVSGRHCGSRSAAMCAVRPGRLTVAPVNSSSGAGPDALQAEVLFERIEVPITVQKPVATDDAPSGQNDINRTANSHPKLPKLPVVLRGRDDDVFTTQHYEFEPPKQAPNFIELLVELAALQNLDEVQIANAQLL